VPTDPAIPPPPTVDARLAQRLTDLERRLAAVEQREGVLVVSSLPSPGRAGRMLMVAGVVYADTGTAWTPL